MQTITQVHEEDGAEKLPRQALLFFTHTVLALVSWLALMMLGYVVNPPSVSQMIVLIFSVVVPLIAGPTRWRRMCGWLD
jgi:membrane protein YdbS with pleckstrin-like domain